MAPTPPSDHFRGLSVPEHLKEARQKGALASAEIHGTELPGHLAAGGDAAKETAFLALILWILLGSLEQFPQIFLLFCFALLLGKPAEALFLDGPEWNVYTA